MLGQMQVLSGKLIIFFNTAASEHGYNGLTLLKNEIGQAFYCSELFNSTVSLSPLYVFLLPFLLIFMWRMSSQKYLDLGDPRLFRYPYIKKKIYWILI